MPAPAPTSRVVLVVDDDPAVARMVAAVLARQGAVVEVAHDGGEALARLARGPVDAVLTDLTMPGMSGLALVRAAEAAGHRMPFLVMSAFLDPETETRLCAEAGVAGVLRKPFEIARLQRDVAALLRRAAPRGLALVPRRLIEQVAAATGLSAAGAAC